MNREFIDGASGRVITVIRSGSTTYMKAGRHDHDIDPEDSDITLIDLDGDLTEIVNHVTESVSYRNPRDALTRSIAFLKRMTSSRKGQLGKSLARRCCMEAVI